MIADLTPYPAYRDSGVEWLGPVPEHWDLKRTKSVLSSSESGVWGHDATDQGVIVLRSTEQTLTGEWDITAPARRRITSAEHSACRLEEGDLLVTKSSGSARHIGKTTIVTKEVANLDCCFSNFMQRLRVTDGTSPRFLWYVLNGEPGRTQLGYLSTTTTGLANLNGEIIGNVVLPSPDVAEQDAIVRFLDRADQLTRRYVLAKHDLVVALEELKQAITHRVVTGQIEVRTGNPYPAYKDSGVAWLGRVPEHWNVVRLGKVIAVQPGFPFKSEGFTQNAEDPRLLRGVNIAPGRLRWEDTVRWPAVEADTVPLRDYRLRTGDIVLGMDRPVIRGGTRVAVVTDADVPSLLLQRVARIRPGPKLRRDFAFLLLSGKQFADYMAPIFTGISVPHLSPEQIKAFTVALPGLGEQDRILGALAPEIRGAQRAADSAARQIERMNEYRTRLIADVVTGKLDVREAAAVLPDQAPA